MTTSDPTPGGRTFRSVSVRAGRGGWGRGLELTPTPDKYKVISVTGGGIHPVTTFFPYANAGELFVWLGVANGVTQLGLSTVPLAVRYFAVGVVVILIRGVVTELITGYLIRRENKTELFDTFDAEYASAAAGGAK